MSPRWFIDASEGWCSVHRLQWASIEGTHAEMLSLAEALSTPGRDYRGGESYRCAAYWREDGRVDVFSPRNSISATQLTREDAAKLAGEIREEIERVPVPEPVESPFAYLDPVDRLTAELDLIIYGTAVVEREADGTYRVLDPLAVRLRGDLLTAPEREDV